MCAKAKWSRWRSTASRARRCFPRHRRSRSWVIPPTCRAPIWLSWRPPAGTPRIIIDRVHDDVALIMKDPRFRKVQVLDRGLEPVVDSVEQFARFLDTDRRLTGDLVQEAGIEPQ